MLKKYLVCLFFLMSFFSPAVYSAQKNMDEIYKAAEKEGEVTWVSTLREKEAGPIVKAFNKEHPKIKANHQRQHGGQAMERLLREVQTGTVIYDVVQVHEDFKQQFIELGVLERVNWSEFNVEPRFIHYDKRLVGVFDFPYLIVYNTNLIKKEESPKTWEDLLDPKWKGKLIVDSRPLALFNLVGEWGPEKTLEYCRKLGKNKPVFLRGQTKAASLMAAGDYMLHSGCYLASAIFVKNRGGALDWNFPDPIPTSWADFGILKGTKHPNAGKVFLGWLGSKGYKLMDDINWGWSAPFKGSRKEKPYKGKTLSYPPTREQVPDDHKFLLQMLKELGLRK